MSEISLSRKLFPHLGAPTQTLISAGEDRALEQVAALIGYVDPATLKTRSSPCSVPRCGGDCSGSGSWSGSLSQLGLASLYSSVRGHYAAIDA